ncbi:MAG: hypothetical protein LLG20_24200 [Acidobacteriales bacterium]|nr:hypothetical protein [Terriglobales bacterium]
MQLPEDSLKQTRKSMARYQKQKYNWIRFLLTLAAGALTLLVSLQGNYTLHSNTAAFLLRTAWASIGLSVLIGPIVLQGEVHLAKLRAAYVLEQLENLAADKTPEPFRWMHLPKLYAACETLFYAMLLTSVTALTLFAIVNVKID